MNNSLSVRNYSENIEKICSFLLQRFGQVDIAMVLGTGFGDLGNSLEKPISISYNEIPGMPCGGVIGHANKLVFVEISGKKIMIFSGRFHNYEGFRGCESLLIAHVSAFMGAQYLILTNASGGLNPDQNPGDILIMNSYINSYGYTIYNRLKEAPQFGPQILEVENAFDKEAYDLALKVSKEQNLKLFEGCYIVETGPVYETNADEKMLIHLGTDVVGMSTVPEIQAASAFKIKILAFSMITDVVNRVIPTTHEEVCEHCAKALPKVVKLINGIIPCLKLNKNYVIPKMKFVQEDLPIEIPLNSKEPSLSEIEELGSEILRHLKAFNKDSFDLTLISQSRIPHSYYFSELFKTSIVITLKGQKGFHYNSIAGKNCMIMIGKYKDKSVLVISGSRISGFNSSESAYICLLLKYLHISFSLNLIETEYLSNSKDTNIILVSDYLSGSNEGLVQSQNLVRCGNHEIKKMHSILKGCFKYDEGTNIFLMDSNVLPTSKERSSFKNMGCDAFGLCGATLFNHLRGYGIMPQIIGINHKLSDENIPNSEIAKEIVQIVLEENVQKQIDEVILDYKNHLKMCEGHIKESQESFSLFIESIPYSMCLKVPHFVIQEEIENCALMLQSFFVYPLSTCILCSQRYINDLRKSMKILKVVKLRTNESCYANLPNIFLAEFNGNFIALVDFLYIDEGRNPECLGAISTRLLALIGIRNFIVLADFISASNEIKCGESFLVSDFTFHAIHNSLIGKNIEKWGVRFLDIKYIFDSGMRKELKEKNKTLKEEIILCIPGIKPYIFESEVIYAQRINLKILMDAGIAEALTAFHMNRKVCIYGIVGNSPIEIKKISMDEKEKAVHKFISTIKDSSYFNPISK